MKDTTLFKIVAIVCITVLEICNLIFLKADGALFGIVIALVAGLAGYQVGLKVQKINNK